MPIRLSFDVARYAALLRAIRHEIEPRTRVAARDEALCEKTRRLIARADALKARHAR